MESPSPETAALGIESHSGWAAVVAIGGSRSKPVVLYRGRVEIADPKDSRAKQPFHAAEEMTLPRARTFLAASRSDARKRATDEMRRVLAQLRLTGARAGSCAILTASTEKAPPLESILASHARIHAAEGDHFRDALARAASRAGLSVVRIRRKDLPEVASRALGLAATVLERRVAGMRASAGPPWGADQKLAALAAWSLLRG